jgi:6-phosphogluconolactonase
MLRKSSLSVGVAILVIAVTACGHHEKQPSVVVPLLRSIVVIPEGAQLELGMNQQFTAIGVFSDGTTQDVTASASWSSSDQNVVRVNTTAGRVGLGNTRGPGTATISAAVNTISGSTVATITRRVPKFLYGGGTGGITGYSINVTTGALTQLASPQVTAVGDINSLAVTRDRQFLYAADFALGGILGFRIDASGALIALPGSPFFVPSRVSSPVSVVASPTADFLFMTDATQGDITSFSIGADGALTALTPSSVVGPALFAAVTPDGKFLHQARTASPTIKGLSIAANGRLSPIADNPVQTGTLPRMVTVDPSGRFLYAVDLAFAQDPTASVFAFGIDAITGALTPVIGSPFTAGKTPVVAATDASGRFLYTANAIGNSVSGFSVDAETGALTNVPGTQFPTGTSPVSVAVDPGAQFVYVGLSDHPGVQAFTIDQRTGALTEIVGSPFPAPGSILAIASTY